MSAQELPNIFELLDEHDGQSGAVAALSLSAHSARAILSVLPADDEAGAKLLRLAIDRIETARDLFKMRKTRTAAKVRAEIEIAAAGASK